MLSRKIKPYFISIITCFILLFAPATMVSASDIPLNPDGTTMSADEVATYEAHKNKPTEPPATQQAAPVETPAPVQPQTQKETTTEETTTENPKIQATIAAIKNLPKTKNLSLDDQSAVNAIRKSYDSLTKSEKKKVDNYKTLIAAEEKIAELEREAAKIYNYSFVVEEDDVPIVIRLSSESDPDLTLVSPSGKALVITEDLLVSDDIIYEIERKTDMKNIEKPVLWNLYISDAVNGVWAIRSSVPLDISTGALEEETTTEESTSEEITETTIEETTTAQETESASKAPALSFFGSTAFNKILLYAGVVMALVAAFVITTVYLLKKKGTTEENPEQTEVWDNNDTDYGDIEFVNTDEPETDNAEDIPESSTEQKKQHRVNRWPVLKNKKRNNEKNVQEEAEIPDETMIDVEEYDEEPYIEDELARLKAAADKLWKEVEPDESTKKANTEKNAKKDVEKVRYVTQEDIDNDITIEEYIGGEESTSGAEMDEKIRKRRSFFPDDRFS